MDIQDGVVYVIYQQLALVVKNIGVDQNINPQGDPQDQKMPVNQNTDKFLRSH